MPPKKKKTSKKGGAAVKPLRLKCRSVDIPRERDKLQARLSVLLVECEDYWAAKRGNHSHVMPIFTEYWRLVDLARDLYPENPIFFDLDIHDVTQPNADDIQALEMDVRKMLAVFDVEEMYEEN